MEQNIEIIKKAAEFAVKKHKGQKRDGGQEEYIVHPMQVALLLSLITQDPHVVAAAYLHDTIEDTDTTYEELLQEFGKDIADLVNEVTHEGAKDEFGFYFPRLKTKRGIMIKLADRLSNINAMETWPISRQEQYLRKTKFWNSEKPSEPSERERWIEDKK